MSKTQQDRACSWVAGAIARARRTGEPQQSADWGGWPERRRCVTIWIENGQLHGEAVDCLAGAG